MKVLEEGVVDYIKKRNLAPAYLKAKKHIEMGFYKNVICEKETQKKRAFFTSK